MESRPGVRRTRALLRLTFAAIAAILVIGGVLTYVQWRNAIATVNEIESNALASVRLLGRMGFDIERERVLIDRHVFEHDPARMTHIEGQIERVRHDYAGAAEQYAPLTTFEQEAIGWFRLTSDVAAARPLTEAALDRSRSNRDADAEAVLLRAEPIFEAVAHDTTALLDINQATSARARAGATRLESRLLDAGVLATVIILAMTVLVGWRVTRTIAATEDTLHEQALQLEGKNRELDAFAGRIAHDLRGPLHTIGLAMQILAERAPGEATIKIVRRGIGQMSNLVEDLLGLSRIGQLEGSVANIASVVALIEPELRPMVTDAGGTLRVEVPPASVCGSEGLLRQVLWNLGENAIKYRRPAVPPEIEILGRTTAAGYELRVIDNGLGMTPDETTHAFEPFFRGERTRSIAGTGLGLAIVRRVIEASGGTIALDSRPGEGSTFTIRLPLARSSADELA